MSEVGSNRRKLSFDQADKICRGLIPIGDEVYSFMDSLQRASFLAWVPRHRYIESFAETSEELEIHRRCVIEEAKNRLGNPRPLWPSREGYRSTFIQELEARRDQENGVPRSQLEKRYSLEEAGWRIQYDPCLRRRVLAGLRDRDGSRERFTTLLEEEESGLRVDTQHHATGLGRTPHAFHEAGRYSFFSEVMLRDSSPLGFEYDKVRSTPDCPIFSKTITSTWAVCWVLEEPMEFSLSPFEGRFEPYLELRGQNLRGRLVSAKPGQLLMIRYASVVPGFSNAYGKFHDLDELETEIKAHLYLYSLMAPIIEEAIRTGLSVRRGQAEPT